jgi:tRNA pseudouridine32 synthase/23S rRNA pseudouridine746 synthase
LTFNSSKSDQYFNSLEVSGDNDLVFNELNLRGIGEPHPLCLAAAHDLQDYLGSQNDFIHNFGLDESEEGKVIGKMFGVLVVKTEDHRIGYLAAFSGKLAGSNHHPGFVPPVYDTLSEDGFVNDGMKELAEIITKIKSLEEDAIGNKKELDKLKEIRKQHSYKLQMQIYDHYYFLNEKGEEKSLNELFREAGFKNPPSGAGECAGPKLLQYAFLHNMKPLAIAEFWWGQSPKSEQWKHGQFYACCKEKCEPILAHMLKDL